MLGGKTPFAVLAPHGLHFCLEVPLTEFGYSSKQVASMLGVSVGIVRAYVRAGFLEPKRGARGLLFSFQDLVLLRAAKALLDEKISARRIHRALVHLRERLPVGRPLSALSISAHGRLIVVRDGARVFEPESGQALFDFHTGALGARAALIVRAFRSTPAPTAKALFAWGCEIEIADRTAAQRAYEQAIELDPHHADALVNLGRLRHEAGLPAQARTLYERALETRPDDAIAAFNLGVALEDIGESKPAMSAYRRAVKYDPRCADAHYNLARLYEQQGERTRALRHLGAYQRLMR